MNDSAKLTKLALLIDGDNVSATFMPLIMREAAKHGGVAVRRIYGQFESGKMKSWQKHIVEFDLTPVNVTPLTRGKNATDMKLVIEAMDMLHGRQLDGFCIVSSDGDFTPLAARIRANALAAFGFGAKKAPAKYKAAFDRFCECDTLLASEKKAPVRKASKGAPKTVPAQAQRPPPKPPATAKLALPADEILAAIEAARRHDGWSHLSEIKKRLSGAIADFKSSNYGHRQIGDLVLAVEGTEAKPSPRGVHYVRRRRAT
jgi:uncharacterized LabA/DUF88 family protein